MSDKVTIHLYDLSQGMARQLSMAFIGKQIEGIWHTGIVVYGKEYYYGGGICRDPPGQTPYGNPIKKIDAGETDIPEEVFLDFLKDVTPKFTIDKYDLFENNCNNFTDTACEFLTGKGIPDYITGLPKDVLATPFGQMIKPMIDGFTNTLNQNSHPISGGQPSLPQLFEGQSNPSMLNFGANRPTAPTTNTATTAHTGPSAVQEVTTIEQFFEVLDAYPAVIVDFFSYTCPPCIRIKPFFEKTAQDYQKINPKLKFVSVNTQVAREIAMNHNITAIPTFIGFFDALQVERFSGADQARIMSLVQTLDSKIKAMPNKDGQNADSGVTKTSPEKVVQGYDPAKKELYRFEGDTYGLAINSIKSTLEKHPTLNQSESKAVFVVFSKDPQNNAKNFPEEEKFNLTKWVLDNLIFLDISDKTIGFLDLLKMLSVDKTYSAAVVKNTEEFGQIIRFFDKPEASLREIQKGLRLVLLRLITNVSAHEETKGYFQSQVVQLVKILSVAAKAYKDEKPALFAIFMTLWNLTQNLNGTQEFEEVKDIIVGLATETFNTSLENDLQVACVQIFSVLSFNNRNLRSALNENLNKQKLSKLESGNDAKASKATKDLLSILH